jgi:hypothetical protein
MSRGSGASALAAVLGLAGLVALAGCPSRRKAERTGPFLSILREEAEEALPPAGEAVPPRSIALALGGLPREALTELREHLTQWTDGAVRRAAPMLFDLELGDDDDAAAAPDPLRKALPDLPALTAAVNVLGGPWSGPGLTVRIGPSCADAASRCVPLFVPRPGDEDRSDDLVRRGRALAWTLGNAVLRRVPAGSRASFLESLREAQTRPASTIALVFAARQGALDEAELELVRDQARVALAHLPPGAPQRPWLEALGAAPGRWELPIALDDDEVLVIPRLSALARLQDFRSEIDHAPHPRPTATSEPAR